jgi:hypothetical protein
MTGIGVISQIQKDTHNTFFDYRWGHISTLKIEHFQP